MKIMLICYGGLSTSILVNKMKSTIAESEKFKDKGIVVEAWGKEEYEENLNDTRVILLGPQVSMIKEEVEKNTKDKAFDVPVLVINKDDYGMMNPVPILKEAFLAIKNHTQKNKL